MKNFDNLEFIKIKILSSKGTVGNERQATTGKKFAKDLSDKECYPKCINYF